MQREADPVDEAHFKEKMNNQRKENDNNKKPINLEWKIKKKMKLNELDVQG